MNDEDFNELVRQEMMKMEAEFVAMMNDDVPDEQHTSQPTHDHPASSYQAPRPVGIRVHGHHLDPVLVWEAPQLPSWSR